MTKLAAVKFKFPGGQWTFPRRPLIMGIINATPDSFSDGGSYKSSDAACQRAMAMVEEGADIIDVGGESTRPGAAEVPADAEIARVCPIIAGLHRRINVPISVDTRKSAVAEAAIDAGAAIINDVSGLQYDAGMPRLISSSGAGYIGMHMRGTPQTMQSLTEYDDIIAELRVFFHNMIDSLDRLGVSRQHIAIDPGIGFGKTVEQNLEIIKNLNLLDDLQCPILMGVSRKSFIGRILGITAPEERDWGTAAAVAACVLRGAQIHRVHNVARMRQVVDMAAACTSFNY